MRHLNTGGCAGRAVALAACWLLAFAAPAPANLILNGDFEQHSYSGSYREFLTAGSAGLANWAIPSGDIDLYYNAALATPPTPPLNGSKSWLDMNGDHLGTIAQSFATVAGTQYTVTFDLGGNPDSAYGPAIKTLQVSAAGQSALFTCDTQYTAWNWAAKTWTFTANSSTTDLRFTSLSGSGYNRAGPALDNVSVSPIPEPSTIGLAATAAAGLAWLAWRRKRNA